MWSVDWDNDDPVYRQRRIKRVACQCWSRGLYPNLSARPSGRLRHLFCRRCHGFTLLTDLESSGLILYGTKLGRKHYRRPLYWPMMLHWAEILPTRPGQMPIDASWHKVELGALNCVLEDLE
jgi:hypothetical protein